jgi:hypothetical protein
MNIEYIKTDDYSGGYPPQFLPIKNLYNTILIPKHSISTAPQPTDTISIIIDNKQYKQKVVIESGEINFYDDLYYFFYLAPGFSRSSILSKNIQIAIGENIIQLNTEFDASYSAKIINGLIILEDNFSYFFKHINYGLSLNDKKQNLVYITKQQNKYNYYDANKNNTILNILDTRNSTVLFDINQNINTSFIKPLHNKNYPLGSINIISDSGVSNSRIKINNKTFSFNKNANIDYLPAGKYTISLLDNLGNEITINQLNKESWNKSTFTVEISAILAIENNKKSTMATFFDEVKPDIGYSNLLINLVPYHTEFELFGPNNWKRKFIGGYQFIKNIIAGEYKIKYKNKINTILVIKNDNNYFSNI